MKTVFTTFKKAQKQAHSSKNKTGFSTSLGILLLSGMLFLGSTTSTAQTTLVVPDSNEGNAFIGPFGNAARQLQFIIDDTMVTSLVGKKIKSLAFRLPASTAEAWPSTALTMTNFNVFMSNGVEPSERQLDFAANVVGTQTQVRTGALEIPAGALTVGSNPNDFSFKINFNEEWLYEGGNLLIEIRHSGTGISSRTVQAVGTSSTGYGTLFSALWQSTGAVNQGNFCYIELTAVDNLGVSTTSVLDQTSIYPNPVQDVIYLKSEKEFVSYSIYNMVGQQISTSTISGKSTINVGKLSAGQYILKLTDKNGNTQTRPFIKK